jgi:hypothetical protein
MPVGINAAEPKLAKLCVELTPRFGCDSGPILRRLMHFWSGNFAE